MAARLWISHDSHNNMEPGIELQLVRGEVLGSPWSVEIESIMERAMADPLTQPVV